MSWSIGFNARSVPEALSMWDEKVKALPSFVRGMAEPELNMARAHIERLMETPNTFWSIKSYGAEARDEQDPQRRVRLFNVGLEIRREVFG